MTSERGEHGPPVLPELSIHLKSGVLEVLVQLKSCKLKIVIDPPGGGDGGVLPGGQSNNIGRGAVGWVTAYCSGGR